MILLLNNNISLLFEFFSNNSLFRKENDVISRPFDWSNNDSYNDSRYEFWNGKNKLFFIILYSDREK